MALAQLAAYDGAQDRYLLGEDPVEIASVIEAIRTETPKALPSSYGRWGGSPAAMLEAISRELGCGGWSQRTLRAARSLVLAAPGLAEEPKARLGAEFDSAERRREKGMLLLACANQRGEERDVLGHVGRLYCLVSHPPARARFGFFTEIFRQHTNFG